MSGPARRKLCYVTGTRADFGLMASTLRSLRDDPRFDLELIVTGMHLDARYGNTVSEIESDGFAVAAKVPVDQSDTTGATMARNIGAMLQRFVDVLARSSPDGVLLLGDRGEMLAGAIAAIHLGIPIIHLHGGERSGTVDEPVRHAISKFANFHLVATSQSRDRLVRMGEEGAAIQVVGAPGLDGLAQLARVDRQALCEEAGFDPAGRVALLLYHPVLAEAAQAGDFARRVIAGLRDAGCQILALMPNSDAGGTLVRDALLEAQARGALVTRVHLPRERFVSWMAACDVMVGNSSSGIIEAATFGTPVVNVGSRQQGRERNANVADVQADAGAVAAAVGRAFAQGRLPSANVYGAGNAGKLIVEALAGLALRRSEAGKVNAY